jgi:hypothetical protein
VDQVRAGGEAMIHLDLECQTCGQKPCGSPVFCRACRAASFKPWREGKQTPDPFYKPPSTPKSTVDALIHVIRTGGVAALKEPVNLERLSRCDDAARARLNAFIDCMQAEAKHDDAA